MHCCPVAFVPAKYTLLTSQNCNVAEMLTSQKMQRYTTPHGRTNLPRCTSVDSCNNNAHAHKALSTQGILPAITQVARVLSSNTYVHVVHLHPVLYFSTVHTRCVMSHALYMLHCSPCSLTLYRASVHRTPCNPLYLTHCTAPTTPGQCTCITHVHAWPKREF